MASTVPPTNLQTCPLSSVTMAWLSAFSANCHFLLVTHSKKSEHIYGDRSPQKPKGSFANTKQSNQQFLSYLTGFKMAQGQIWHQLDQRTSKGLEIYLPNE